MAAARGLDPSGNPILVAWGGMKARATADSSGALYYLYSNSTTPTWSSDTAPTTAAGFAPKPLVHASLVFSHVTGKFYLFGGYDPGQSSTNAIADTWELSFNSSSNRSCGTSGGCKFQWRKLTPSCYPNCTAPPARWGHQSVEVNYHYFNAPYEPTCSDPTTPCSFGIFMEGGRSSITGLQFFSDRWVFDPTGNQGQGHWQLMADLPPRSFSAMTSIDYQTINGGTQHLGLLFGGETGLQNPAYYSSGNYFVPPTLGDTWMYDFDQKVWNRVQLLGTRYSQSIPASLDQRSARAASLTSDTTTQILTPPPVSGGILVTRTLSRATHSITDTPNSLALPEVFLIGGRNKEGKYQPFSSVYKFCAGSSGEKNYRTAPHGIAIPLPDDASCDSYDPIKNPNSPNPQSGYSGRWLYKNPTSLTPSLTPPVSPDQMASFLGAGTYDPQHDLILVYGGLTASPNPTRSAFPFSSFAVTDSTQRTVNGADGGIYEYTPPSKLGQGASSDPFNGSWDYIPACNPASIPVGRYGHSLSYDPVHSNLIMTGGFDANGNLLTQTQVPSSGGSAYVIPEVWNATRMDEDPSSQPLNGISSTDLGSTFPCYYWSKVTQFGNTPGVRTLRPPQSGVAHASTLVIPSVGYNTGYYTLNGPGCAGTGTTVGTDQNIGGVYLDLDRTQLSPTENLLLSVTLLPMGPSQSDPQGNALASSQSAYFRVTLVQTQQSQAQLISQTQPRALVYANTSSYPIRAYDIAVLAPPVGQIREEQILVPISMDPNIDRIRIERISGSGMILNASLSRLKAGF